MPNVYHILLSFHSIEANNAIKKMSLIYISPAEYPETNLVAEGERHLWWYVKLFTKIIREADSLSTARAKKGLPINKMLSPFIGQIKKKSSKYFSIVSNATAWIIHINIFEHLYRIPQELARSSYRPDIFLVS